jgi:hypothetical protein
MMKIISTLGLFLLVVAAGIAITANAAAASGSVLGFCTAFLDSVLNEDDHCAVISRNQRNYV